MLNNCSKTFPRCKVVENGNTLLQYLKVPNNLTHVDLSKCTQLLVFSCTRLPLRRADICSLSYNQFNSLATRWSQQPFSSPFWPEELQPSLPLIWSPEHSALIYLFMFLSVHSLLSLFYFVFEGFLLFFWIYFQHLKPLDIQLLAPETKQIFRNRSPNQRFSF